MFLPTLKRTDPQYLEWNKFSRMISNEYVNCDEVANYVDGIHSSNSTNSFQSSFEKKDLPFMRKKEEQGNQGEMAFNPSKTFGGERARMMFMKGENKEDEGTFGGKGESKRDLGGPSGQSLLPGL